MKKALVLLAVVTMSAAIAADAAESKIGSYVNQKLTPITTKEKELNTKIEAQKKADAAKKAELEKKQAELKKQQEANKKAIEQAKKDVEAEKSFWKSIFKK